MSTQNVEVLAQTAVAAGFDSSFVADVLQKLGPAVLNTLVDGVKNGFSVSTVTELLQNVGPTLLDIVVHALAASKAAKAGFALNDVKNIVVGQDVSNSLDVTVLQALIEKFVPILINQYGPLLLQTLLQVLSKSLTPTA